MPIGKSTTHSSWLGLLIQWSCILAATFLFLQTVKDVWDVVVENYSTLRTFQKFFRLRIDSKVSSKVINNIDVIEYYNSLQLLWQKLDMHYESDWGDLEDNKKF